MKSIAPHALESAQTKREEARTAIAQRTTHSRSTCCMKSTHCSYRQKSPHQKVPVRLACGSRRSLCPSACSSCSWPARSLLLHSQSPQSLHNISSPLRYEYSKAFIIGRALLSSSKMSSIRQEKFSRKGRFPTPLRPPEPPPLHPCLQGSTGSSR